MSGWFPFNVFPHMRTRTALVAALAELSRLDGADATVLIKGSRFMQLDRVVDGLVAAEQSGGKPRC